MRSQARRAVLILAWLLLVAALGMIALNPAVPSPRYALLWLGVMAITRAVALPAPDLGLVTDIVLVFICLLGLEIGGLLLLPSVITFALADALYATGDTAT
jgi:hypothetical protein